MQNYLLPILEKYFSEILSIDGKLLITESFLEGFKEEIMKQSRQDKNLVGAITTYRHLSILGKQPNLFSPNYSYNITTDNLDNEVKNIISQSCCFAVSQAYEVFETFLIEILKEYLFHHQNLLPSLRFDNCSVPLLRETIRDELKTNKMQKNNNKGLIGMVKKISAFFRKHEAENTFDVQITQWFDLVSMIRHTLVHNRQVISVILLNYIKDAKVNEMFERQFKRKVIGNEICIYLNKNQANDIITWLNAFAHFIFMSLSTEGKLDYNVPQYNPNNF